MNKSPQNKPQTQAPSTGEALPMRMDVKIHTLRTAGPILANASVTLNGCFAVRGIKVIQGSDGPFVSMPSYKGRDGYKDICFPCTKEFHQQFNDAVVDAFRQTLSQAPQRQEAREQQAPPVPQMSM